MTLRIYLFCWALFAAATGHPAIAVATLLLSFYL